MEDGCEWLPLLLFVTVVHELCHYIIFHAKVKEIQHVLASETRKEAGECWELTNLGGIVGHIADPKRPYMVRGLFLETSGDSFLLDREAIGQVTKVMSGFQPMPITLQTSTLEPAPNLQRVTVTRHCIDDISKVYPSPYTGPRLILVSRPPDRIGRESLH
jgi:hypothetical protein